MLKHIRKYALAIIAFCIFCIHPLQADAAGEAKPESQYDKETFEAFNIQAIETDKIYDCKLKDDQIQWYSFTPETRAYYTFTSDSEARLSFKIYTYNSSSKTYKSTTNSFYYQGGNIHHPIFAYPSTTYYFAVYYDDIKDQGPAKISMKSNKKVVSYDGCKNTTGYGFNDYSNFIDVNFTYEDGTKGGVSVYPYSGSERDDFYNRVYVDCVGDEKTIENFENSVPGTYKLYIEIYDSASSLVYETESEKDYVTYTILSPEASINSITKLSLNTAKDVPTTYNGEKVYSFTPSVSGVYGFTFAKKKNAKDDLYCRVQLQTYNTKENIFNAVDFSIAYPSAEYSTCIYQLEKGTTYYLFINSSVDASLTAKRYQSIVPVTSVKMSASATVAYGETFDLYSTLTFAPANATNTNITWKTSNAKVATVNKGIVTATGYGTAEITATMGGKTAKCTITVSPLKKGDKFDINGMTYKITKEGLTGGTVAFAKGADKKSISIPKTITYQGITYKVTSIGANACAGNTKLKKLTIGANVGKIGKNAFKGCKKLSSINVKTKKLTAKKIGKGAFAGISKKAKIKATKKKLALYKKIILK